MDIDIEATPWFQITDKDYQHYLKNEGIFYRCIHLITRPNSASGKAVVYKDEWGFTHICPSMLTFYSDEERLLE